MTQSKKPTTRLDFQMSEAVAGRLAELRASIRGVSGHSEPTPRTLVSALIMAELRRGDELEHELLVPFRLGNRDAD